MLRLIYVSPRGFAVGAECLVFKMLDAGQWCVALALLSPATEKIFVFRHHVFNFQVPGKPLTGVLYSGKHTHM